MEDSTLDPILAQITKEPLDHVEPGGARWREVKVEVRVTLLPSLDLVMLVRGVVVANDMNILASGDCFADEVEKANPFLMTMLLHAVANDAAVGDVERGE